MTRVSQGMWECPKTSTSVSGYAAAARRSRPVDAPVSCTRATRSSSTSKRAKSGRRSSKPGASSLLPRTPTNDRLRACRRSTVARSTQSPACTTRSAASTSAQSAVGRSFARFGRWVSDSTRSEVLTRR
ncbi:hypothetical protein BIU98_04280 [Curtobacterium sp. MMLR14_010]|nr:hypothetical protein BIU98_04280 [Curtobacterium sp. MMLR14_010]